MKLKELLPYIGKSELIQVYYPEYDSYGEYFDFDQPRLLKDSGDRLVKEITEWNGYIKIELEEEG